MPGFFVWWSFRKAESTLNWWQYATGSFIAVERVVLPLISGMRSSMEQEHFIAVVARHLGSSAEAVRASVPKGNALPEDVIEEPIAPSPAAKEVAGADRALLIRAAIAVYPETPLAKRLRDEYARIIGPLPSEEQLPERALFEAGLLFGETPTPEAGDDVLRALERTVLADELRGATMRLRQAESAKDEESVRKILNECKDISTRLATLG
jgi:hypothetical protein